MAENVSHNEDIELTPIQRRRLQDRKEWEAYWLIRKLDAEGAWWPTFRYHAHRFFDRPATWFREKIVEPSHDKHKLPYYHRRFSRAPEIDECGVNDQTCIAEANEQHRIDKVVDYYILQILRQRLERCLMYNNPNLRINSAHPCVQAIEDYEQAELNNFIKYGELGSETDVRTAYTKQKHRLIWERRHPEIMAERERKYQEYLEKKRNGHFDMSFWKKGLVFQDKKNYEGPFDYHISKPSNEGDRPLSRDWQYYKRVAQDPEFDKEQGHTSNVPLF